MSKLTAPVDGVCFHTTPKAAQSDYLGILSIFVDCTNQPRELDDDTVKQIINMDIGQNCRCDLNWTYLNEIPPFDGNTPPDHLDQLGSSFITIMTPSNSNNFY